MEKRYIVRLTRGERQQLQALVKKGKGAASRIQHAHILLQADASGPAWKDRRIAEAFGCHAKTVYNVRERAVLEGLEAALERKKQERPSRERILDGEGEAQLIALSCSEPPEGHSQWTLQLLADKLVEFGWVDSISYETVRRTLKKTNCNPIGGSAG